MQIAVAIRKAERFKELNQLYTQLETEKQKSDQLLLNILPVEIADRLKQDGEVKPTYHEWAFVLFADFKDFTKLSELLTPQQ